MKVRFKKPMPRLLAGAIACALPLVAGATDTQYSSNFQPIVERVHCWIVSKPIEGNCQLVDRRSSSLVGGANPTVMSYRALGAATPCGFAGGITELISSCFYKHVAVQTAR